MKKHGRQTKTAARDSSVGKGTKPGKTYNLRKRKYEWGQDGEDERSINIPNPKQRRVQTEDNEETTDRSPTPSARRSNHPTSTSKSNVKHGKLQDVKTKETMKRKALKKSKGVHLDVGYETKRAQKVNLSSIQHTKDRKDKINKHTSSKHCQQVKKNREKESLRNQKASLTKQIKQSRTTHPGGKSLTFNKSSHRNNIVVKEEILRSNNDLNSKAESFKKSKAEVIKQTLQGNERILDKKTQNTVTFTEETSAKDFFNLFLTKINVEHHPKVGLEQKFGWIHALGVSEDNLVWVNHFGYTVQLRNTTGEVIRTFELDFRPVFNCCTPSGDLLVTQGYGATKPIITSISREGDVKVLADLSSLATNLCGILCQDEDIFVVAHKAKGKKYFIIKLTENGKVKGVYPTQKSSDDINHIISLNGQIVAIRTFGGGFIPLETNEISSRKINKVDITFYSASASMDKFGNVIMASNTSLFIINPSLEYRHEMATGISAEITSTAVDQENRLWFGTKSGDVYSTKYLK
ncbi:uncharacterized protein LOC134279131 isoform X2 [Saccostrea cucullata]|uniref:uncharacterized protein LOC134279131 isoform X2 n=1 Tax=Saccostrea cuccullata TaxID=36930 RepID=UPI002ED3CAEA